MKTLRSGFTVNSIDSGNSYSWNTSRSWRSSRSWGTIDSGKSSGSLRALIRTFSARRRWLSLSFTFLFLLGVYMTTK